MKIYITGEITDKPFEGCYCPDDLKNTLEGVNENEPLEVEITSEGGSVFAGLQLSNILNRWKGEVTTHAVGFVASIATVILMAGKKIVVDSNCFCLIHLPWSVVQGNKNDLEKEIDALEKCKHAMMSYYMRHSKVSAEEIEKCLENETWLLGDEFAELFDVEILESDETLDIAAKFDLSKYKNIPTRILNMKNNEEIVKADAKPVNEEEEQKKEEEVVEETKEETTTEEPSTEETSTEEKKEEPVEEKQEEPSEEEEKKEEEETIKQYEEKIAELEARIAELEEELEKQKEVKPDEEDDSAKGEIITKAECEKRVSGM
jgi:ATP-dependent protease ClpP protease subunit